MHREIEFTSADGVNNALQLFAAPTSNYVILIAPAMGVPARRYFKLAKALQAGGVSAATFDLRGIGKSSIRASRRNNFGYADIVQQDYPAAVEALQQASPDTQLVMLGHSLGGQLTCLHLSQQPAAVKGIILCASCSVYYKSWPLPGRLGLFLMTQTSALIAHLVGYFPGRKLGFGGREARGVMRDWARNARNGRYRTKKPSMDYELDLAKIKRPILAINFADDLFAPLTATQALLDKMDSHDISYVAIDAAQLGTKRADHFNWAGQPEPVANKICEWLDRLTR